MLPPIPRQVSLAAFLAFASAFPQLTFAATAIGIGSDEFNELGTGISRSALQPVQIATGTRAIAAAKNTTFLLKADNTLWGSGENGGKLGNGTSTPSTAFIQIATDVKSVAVSDTATFWIKSNNTLWATGTDLGGNLGDGNTTPTVLLTPKQVQGNVAKVIPGTDATLVLRLDNSLWLHTAWAPAEKIADNVSDACIAKDDFFYLTNGTLIRRFTYSPVSFTVATNVQAATRGHLRNSVVFLGTDGTLRLQDESNATSVLDTQVTSISGGLNHVVWTKSNNTLWGLGRNAGAQLGTPDRDERGTPVQIASNVASATAGENQTFWVRPDATAWAIGLDNVGQLGRGQALASYSSWVPLRAGIRQVHASDQRTQLVDTSGRLWAAGSNANGELGDGTRNPITSFKVVARGVNKVSGAGSFSTYLTQSGQVFASGFNQSGAFGDATVQTSTPRLIASGAKDASSGVQQTSVVMGNGALLQSGFSPDSNPTSTFTQIASGVKATTVCSSDTGFFVKDDDSLWAYGVNLWGQFGNGGTNDSYNPIKVADNVLRAISDGNISAVLTKDGTLKFSGRNALNLSNPNELYYRNPRTIATNVVEFSLRGNALVYVKKDGTAWQLGYSDLGHSLAVAKGHSDTPTLLHTRALAVSATRGHIVLLVRDEAGLNKDFNGDGLPDVVWHNPWHRHISLVTQSDGRYTGLQSIGTLPDNAEIVGVADFNNDDKADLLARSPNGNLTVWRIDGTSIVKHLFLGAFPTGWRVAGVADMNGDAIPDIVAQNESTGAVGYSAPLRNIATPTALLTIPAGWNVVGAADFNGDQQPELFLHNPTTGQVNVMNVAKPGAGTPAQYTVLAPGTTVVGVADYDGDTHPDLLTYVKSTGVVSITLHNGTSVVRTNGLVQSKDYYPRN